MSCKGLFFSKCKNEHHESKGQSSECVWGNKKYSYAHHVCECSSSSKVKVKLKSHLYSQSIFKYSNCALSKSL